MSEHTPGPWIIFIDGDDINCIVAAGHPGVVAGRIKSEANARLIAAAPELLEALKNATFALALIAQADGNEDNLKAARAAIAKAEGRS